jgi:hypothetical protein
VGEVLEESLYKKVEITSHDTCPSLKLDASAFSTTSLFILPTKNYEIKI